MKFSVLFLLAVSCAYVQLVQGFNWTQVKSVINVVPDTGIRLKSPRIIGGTQATRHQFPYQVGIVINDMYFCGGSLISNTTIITAAHCTAGGNYFRVHLGAQNLEKENEIDRQIVVTNNFLQHAGYNENTIKHDIALIFLLSAVTGTGIESIRIPSKLQESDTFEGSETITSGWGVTENGRRSQELLYVNLKVISNNLCKAIFGSIVTPTQICTDSRSGTKGTCNGDSGGPLVIIESDGKPTLIGIVSFGAVDCLANAPSAFTRVTSYIDWIETNGTNGDNGTNGSYLKAISLTLLLVAIFYDLYLCQLLK